MVIDEEKRNERRKGRCKQDLEMMRKEGVSAWGKSKCPVATGTFWKVRTEAKQNRDLPVTTDGCHQNSRSFPNVLAIVGHWKEGV